MTDKQNFEGWADRHKRMGLDEVKDNIPHFQSKALHSVEELEQLVGNIPVLEKQRKNILTGRRNWSRPRMRKAILNHIMGLCTMTPEQIAQIDRELAVFPVDILSSEKATVTPEKPLIINSGTCVVSFKELILDGGYIEISTPCEFTVDKLTRTERQSAQFYDIILKGHDGEE